MVMNFPEWVRQILQRNLVRLYIVGPTDSEIINIIYLTKHVERFNAIIAQSN